MTWALRPGAVSAAERGGGWPLPGCAGLGGALGIPAAPRQGDRQDGDVSTPRGKGEAVKRAAGTGSLRKPPAPLFSPRSPRFSPHSTEHSRGGAWHRGRHVGVRLGFGSRPSVRRWDRLGLKQVGGR